MSKLFVGVLAIAVSSAYMGPSTASSQGPPPPDSVTSRTPTPSAPPSIVFEKQHMRVRVEEDGRGTRTMTMHIRANDDAGVRQAGQIPLLFAPSSDELEITSLAVHKPDGRIVTAGPEAVQDHAIQPSAQIPVFVDLRQKTVTVPALQPGDTIAITAVWTVARPLAGRHSWFEHSFVKHAVVTEELLELEIPAGMQTLVRVGPSAPPEQNGGDGRVVGDRRVYTWRTSNAKIPVDDDGTAPDEEPVADVRITTFPDWQAFSDWLGPLMRPAVDAPVREKARQLTAGLTDRVAKIDAIYTYVATQIRYVSLSFGLNRYAPHSPADVLKNQYGDCKDKHALMAAMLREVGVEAIPVLLNTSRSISEDVPAPTEFDHVVTAIPNGDDPADWWWFDTTLEVAPAGLLAPGARDRAALALGDGRRAPRVVRTPRDGPFRSVEEFFVTGDVNVLGLLTADVRIALRGDSELILRGALRAMPREALKEFGAEFARAIGFRGEIADFTFSDPLATREPFELRFGFRQPGYLDWAASTTSITPVMGSLDLQGFDNDRSPLTADRTLRTGSDLRRTFRLRLPAGYTAAAPVGVEAAADDYTYTSAYSVESNLLQVERTLRGQPRRLLVARAEDYARIARSINADAAQKFTVTRTVHTTPQIPDEMSALELYSAGYSAFNAKDYETSIAIWERTAAKDPKMAMALNGLGFAYQRLERYDDAIAALEKQRAIEPTNKKINSDLGFVYKEARRLEQAADAYARHLATSPVDGATHGILGEIYFDLGRDDDAVAALEKALSVVKDDPWLHQQLGRALLKLGRQTDALKAFEAALASNKTPAMTSSIAWSLADVSVEPARVLDLSSMAIDAIRDEMKGVAAASVSADHFALMERLAWAWDARGLVHMGAGRLDEALRAFESAWQLGATADTALHLAQAYEKKERLVDAATYFLTARMLDSTPGPELEAGLARHYKGVEVESLIGAARANATRERSVQVPASGPDTTKAELNAVLDADGKVVDLAALADSQPPVHLLEAIRGMRFPLAAPGAPGMRLAARIRVECLKTVCFASVVPPRTSK